jgi:hypothetical protein
MTTELEEGWDDAACLGSFDSFEDWLERRGLERFAEHGKDHRSYEEWVAFKLRNDVLDGQARIAAENFLRKCGWQKLDGAWQYVRPESIAASGEFVTREQAA